MERIGPGSAKTKTYESMEIRRVACKASREAMVETARLTLKAARKGGLLYIFYVFFIDNYVKITHFNVNAEREEGHAEQYGNHQEAQGGRVGSEKRER
ncbi:hypothetical protein G3N56_18385 [Desulfovibrio sulfodismutans]|uniref:Uncharacterized protein n=1 Tax=Desulfolutivibrio sulfodismutans TaxID=63561 RepID=A0A7K3NR97_9BACT|nr:hypothetical protein [Desulfolutivibrio sulfodismutans]NDY58708.1 hypothetical protein [Desulfolutivibrio sulfodismutans]